MQVLLLGPYLCTFGEDDKHSAGCAADLIVWQSTISSERQHRRLHHQDVVGEHSVQEHGRLVGATATKATARRKVRVSVPSMNFEPVLRADWFVARRRGEHTRKYPT